MCVYRVFVLDYSMNVRVSGVRLGHECACIRC